MPQNDLIDIGLRELLGFDLMLFLIAVAMFELPIIAYSLLGAVVVNLIVGVNHRRDRYIGR